MKPLVTVVINYNSHIPDLIKTLETMSAAYQNLEVIIVCDSEEYNFISESVTNLPQTLNVIYQTEDDDGDSAQRLAINRAEGKYTLLVGSDVFADSDPAFIMKAVWLFEKQHFELIYTLRKYDKNAFAAYSLFESNLLKKLIASSDTHYTVETLVNETISLGYATKCLQNYQMSEQNVKHSGNLMIRLFSYFKSRLRKNKSIKKIYYHFFLKNKGELLHYHPNSNRSLICEEQVDHRKGILYILPWLKVGGVERVFYDLISNIDHNLFRVYLVTTLPDDNVWTGRFIPLVDRVFHLPEFCEADADKVDFVCDYIKANRITCVHISNSQFGYKLSPLIKLHFQDVKIIDTLHMEEPGEPWDYFRFSQKFSPYLDSRVVISDFLKRKMINNYGENEHRVNVIFNGIDLERFNFDPESFSSRRKIVFIGRFVDQKQPLLFVKIADELLKARPDLEFCMVGDGELYSRTKKLIHKLRINSNVELLGQCEDIASFMRKHASIIIAPSTREGFPVIGLEAMATGVPIVASNVPGWNDLINNGVDGIMVTANHVQSYVTSVLLLIDDVEKKKEIIRNAREKVVMNYSSIRMGQLYQKLYIS